MHRQTWCARCGACRTFVEKAPKLLLSRVESAVPLCPPLRRPECPEDVLSRLQRNSSSTFGKCTSICTSSKWLHDAAIGHEHRECILFELVAKHIAVGAGKLHDGFGDDAKLASSYYRRRGILRSVVGIDLSADAPASRAAAQPRMAGRGASPLSGDGCRPRPASSVYSIRHKRSGFEARLLESDGSASVAKDPISLFLVVANKGTSNLVERTWRVPFGVAKVRNLAVAKCGVGVSVDVDLSDSNRSTPKSLRLCFLSAEGKLQDVLKVSEVSR